MKTLYIAIIVISLSLVFILPHVVFAQEYVTVKPAFLKDHSDACSKLRDKFPNEATRFIHLDYTKTNFIQGINQNFTRTIINYNGTTLVSSINVSDLIGFQNDMVSPYSVEYDYPLHRLSSVNYIVGERYYFITAISNIGNKTVDITQFPTVPLTYALTSKNDTTVGYPFTGTLSNGGSMEMEGYIGSLKLESGKSIVSNAELFFQSTNTNLASSISPGQYTLRAVGEILGDVNGTCTGVPLWSQPVDLTVLPEEKVPEFPFTIPILLAGITSILVFYRLKSSFRI